MPTVNKSNPAVYVQKFLANAQGKSPCGIVRTKPSRTRPSCAQSSVYLLGCVCCFLLGVVSENDAAFQRTKRGVGGGVRSGAVVVARVREGLRVCGIGVCNHWLVEPIPVSSSQQNDENVQSHGSVCGD